MRCHQCGFGNPDETRFCGRCGAALDAPPRAQEERKVVTILFADVVGSTPLAGDLDAEELRERMARVFAIAREEIERYGGTVEKFIGDAVMAVFGLPTIHEDDAERAVFAALAMRIHARPFIEAGIVPELRIGITTGEVVANPRAAAKGEFLVTGEAVNLAARLQQNAEAGQILVGETTHAATQWAFEYRRLPPFYVKGKDEKVPAFVCLGTRLQAAAPRGVLGRSAPLVGRRTEVEALQSRFERLLAGEGGIVLITGEPGIGKSRLASEMRRQMAARPLTWVVGRTLSISQAISYWPFIEAIRSAAEITDVAGAEERWAKLTALVTALFPGEVAEIAPYLGTLLGLEVKEEWRDRVRYLDGEAMGRQIYRSSWLFFERLARRQPLVLLFEDLHWIDQSSRALLVHLLPLARIAPILFFATSRIERGAPAAELREIMLHDHRDHYVELALSPLSSEDSSEMVRSLLQLETLAPRIRTLVLEKSEGNPLFVEEVIRALIGLGAIVRDEPNGRWQINTAIDQITIPDTLRAVIVARIDRLDEDIKHVLKTASVIGRNFFYRVLRAIVEAGTQMDRYLEELQRLEFIRERRRMPELEYAFKHALTQEAAYDTILLRVRRELHRRVAATIEQLFAGRLEEFSGLLAYHYARAEDWERAQDHLFKAGDQAVRMAADAEALAYYHQASTAYARAFGDRWDPLQRAVLERKMGEAFYRRGDHQQAMEYLHRALLYLGHPYPPTPWRVRLAVVGELLRQVGHRLMPRVFLRYPAVLRHPPEAEERMRIYEAMGWIDYFVSVDRLCLDALLLLNVSEQYRFLFGISRGSMGLGLICDLIPAFRVAGFCHHRAVEIAEEIAHPLARGLAYLGLALHELHTGEWDASLRHFQQSAEIYRQAGELRQWGAAAGLVAWISRMRGDFATGLAVTHEMNRIGQEAADPQLRGWGLAEHGTALWQTGSIREAVPVLQEGVDLLKSVPDDRWVVATMSSLARCYLRLGEFEKAMAVLDEAHGLLAARGFSGFLGAQPRGALAEACLLAAEQATDETRARWLKRARGVVRAMRRQSRVDIEALPDAYRFRGTCEWLLGRPAAAQKWWRRSLAVAERLGARYDLANTHYEVGRRTGSLLALQRAESIYAAIGAQGDLAQVREALRRAS